MKRISVIALLALAGVVGLGKAMAQSQIRVDVPFGFAVGNKVLPAGTYSITPISDSAIEIQNRATWDAVLTTTNKGGTVSRTNALVFDKYDGYYFLREVRSESAKMNVKLPLSKAEQRARNLEARIPMDGGQVLLALK